MSRPAYESNENLSEEEKVAYFVAAAWGGEPVKLPKFYKCDWGIVKLGSIKALIEIKCRDFMPDKYPTLILSADKWTYLCCSDFALGIPCLFVARFADQSIRYIRPSHQQGFIVNLGGRSDRSDWQDMEPVVHIPIDQMLPIKSNL